MTEIKLTDEQKADLLDKIALQKSVSHFVDRDLYEVQEDWVAQHLRGIDGVGQAASGMELEEQLKDPDVFTVLVPRQNALTKTLISTILDRASIRKPVLLEK